MSTTAPGAGTAPAPEHLEALVAVLGGTGRPVIPTDISPGVAGAVNASRIILNGDVCELIGWRFRETGGVAAASFRLHDGNSAAGSLLAVGSVAAAGTDSEPVMPPGIRVRTGRVFLEIVGGSIEGVIYWR